MTSSFTQSDRPIERASRAIRIASSAVRQPAVLGRMRNRRQSMTSRIVFFLGLSRSRRRNATVTSSQPDASSAATIVASSEYLPVPTKRRERSSVPAMTRVSGLVAVCTTAQQYVGLDRRPRLGERLLRDERLVALVGEPLHGVSNGQPRHAVDLAARPETPADGLHRPVARELVATAPVDIRGAAHRPAQLASKARLFLDLAERALLGSFVGIDLALREGPVVIRGAMHDDDLGFA